MNTKINSNVSVRLNKLSSLDGIMDDLGDSSEHVFNPLWVNDLRVLVNTLPVSRSDFELLTKRLDNSIQYAKCGHPGAARFEVKHVVGSLKKLFGLKQLLKMWVDGIKK